MASNNAGGSRFFKSTAARRLQNYPSDIDRGLSAGQAIGKVLEQFGGVAKSIKQNQVANDLMNAQPTAEANAQAADDPDPDPNPDGTDNLNPTAATDPSGTQNPTPFTGGVDELKQRQDFEKEQLDTEYKKAQIANLLAETQGTGRYAKRATPAPQGVTLGGGSASRWTQNQDGSGDGSGSGAGYGGGSGSKKSGKPAPYVGGTGDAEEDDSLDEPSKVAADFDASQGGRKGTYAAFLANLPSMKPDANGNYTLRDKDGNPTATVLASDVPYWTQRTNAARRAQGLTPIQLAGVPFGQGANPASTDKPGSSVNNPIVLTSKLQVRSLPYGTFVKDPDTGQVSTVDRPKRLQ